MSTEVYAAIRKLLVANSYAKGDCILWAGAKNAEGYGSIKVAGKSWQTHRLSWLIARGNIPSGMCVCHHCDTPSCIRLDHLFLGTRAENNADRDRKGRSSGGSQRGERHPHALLTEDAVLAIYASDEPLKALAARYGVSVSAISSVRLGKSWAHVTAHQQEVPCE